MSSSLHQIMALGRFSRNGYAYARYAVAATPHSILLSYLLTRFYVCSGAGGSTRHRLHSPQALEAQRHLFPHQSRAPRRDTHPRHSDGTTTSPAYIVGPTLKKLMSDITVPKFWDLCNPPQKFSDFLNLQPPNFGIFIAESAIY